MKINQWIVFTGITSVLFISGCGPKAEESAPNETASSPESKQDAKKIEALDPATAAAVKGKIHFEGEVPAVQKIAIQGNPECAVLHPGGSVLSEELLVSNGALQNVFVYVKEGLEGRTFETPSESLTVTNKNCVYAPHVAGLQVNQPVILLNEDATLHNMHSYSKNNKAWNIGLPFQGMKQTKKFDAPEVMITLKCDVHPWMRGYLGVLPHPYFNVSGADGNFELKNLPPGEYVIEAWHEKLGAQSQKIEIKPQETKEIEFTFKAV